MNASEPARPQLEDVWSTSADYQAQFQSDDEVATVVRLLNLDGATALADIGCGNGTFAVAAAQANSRLRVWAFDAMASAVAECGKRAAHLADRFQVGMAWADSVPLADASVDRALCRAVLHHVADARATYAEFARILQPGGLLLLQAPCNIWATSWGRLISDFYALMDHSHRRQYHQPADVIAGLNDVGLFMHRAECWTYRLSDLSEAQVAWVTENGATERFCLQKRDGGAWSVDLYWLRVVATKG